jgi:broad specificity phosphatase PhoE
MCQVVLIRPGATIYDEQKRVQGILDVPLSERGHTDVARMAANLVRSLGGPVLSALYCGPEQNVAGTAEIVGLALGIRARRLDEFRNLDHGLWQGLQIDEIRRRNTKLFRQWMVNPETICPPHGETMDSAMDRIKLAFKPLLRRHHGQAIGLVVAQPMAGVIGCYLRCEPRVQLEEQQRPCGFELIEVPGALMRNGTN